jgi:myotubularin-related protein 6/7/8
VRRGQQVEGTLHLTPHHIIFSHIPDTDASGRGPARARELWITYPIIQTCTLRPAHPSSHNPTSIRLRCRDFTFVCFCLFDEKKARDVYDSIKAWTCKIGRVEKLYAFTYQPQRPEKDYNGWELYDAKQEYKRLGISEKGADKGWRISTLNHDYAVCSSPTEESSADRVQVLPDISRHFGGAIVHVRQYAELCWKVSVANTTSGLDLSTFGQQLFHN